MRIYWISFLVGCLSVSSFAENNGENPGHLPASGNPNQDAFPSFSDTTFWEVQKYAGNGEIQIISEKGVEIIEFSSNDKSGMAASLNSAQIPVEGGYDYLVTLEIKTSQLKSVNAKLVGGPYFVFFDKYGYPAGWYPIADLQSDTPCYMAPETTDWISVRHLLKTPTNACTARLVISYAAFMFWDTEIIHSNPKYLNMPLTCVFEREGSGVRNEGKATGELRIRNVRVEKGGKIPVYQPSISVPDKIIQQSIGIAGNCLHNAQLSGDFKVSSGYITSGNIVPDLSFGLFGIRRLDNPDYINTMLRYWKLTAESMDSDGRITSQRVMSQVFLPIGIDEIFSFTGDLNFLAEFLPIADNAIEYAIRKRDDNGLVRLVDYGKWHISEGADWVDWYSTRMEGKTLMFQLWYFYALQRLACLHEEFQETIVNGKTIGSETKAALYRTLAEQVKQSIRQLYWEKDHFVTNVDYGGTVADEIWLDNQLWAVKFGVATKEQAGKIWAFIDADPAKYEGIPTRWAAFEKPSYGPFTWFGRNGAADIIARYRSGMPDNGLRLLNKISCVINRDGDIFEAYDMNGNIAKGTSGWGNYTEHSGGYIWAIVEGIFGVNFESDNDKTISVKPNFPDTWKQAEISLFVRGTKLHIIYSNEQKKQLLFTGEGPEQKIGFISPNGKMQLFKIGNNQTYSVLYDG